MKTQCTIIGWFGYNNIGDEMILSTLVSHLNPDTCELTVISKDPKQTQQIHNTKSVANNWKAISCLKKSDIIVFGGGQIFNDNRFRTIPYWSIILNLTRILNRKAKICLINQGFEAKNRLLKHILSSTLTKADLITVRDSASFTLTKNMKLKNPISTGPDIVFSTTQNSNKPQNQNKSKPKTIGVNLRPPFWWRSKPDANLYAENLAATFDLLIEQKCVNIVFVPFRIPAKESPTDLEFSEYVKSKLKHQNQVQIHIPLLDTGFFDDLINCFSSFDFFLGTTFHSLVLAIKLGIPLLAFPYQERCRILLNDLNLNQLLISSSELSSPPQLSQKISYALQNRNQIRTQLKSKNADLAEKAKKAHIKPLSSLAP